MANNADDVIKIAKSYIGSKTVGKKSWNYVFGGGFKNGSATPWCACFQSLIFHEAGAKCVGLPTGSCTSGIYKPAKKAGKVVPTSQARKGDLMLMNFDKDWNDADHVGLITAVGSTTFTTVEGNTSSSNATAGGECEAKVRPKSRTFAIIRPDYDEKKEEPKLVVDGWCGPLTIKKWQRVVGSAYVDGVISGQWDHNSIYYPNINSVTFEDDGESQLVKITQKMMGITTDGYIGPNYVKALQKRLGMEEWQLVKGRKIQVIGPETVKALQTRLNTGKF